MTSDNKNTALGCGVIVAVALVFMAIGGLVTYLWMR